MSKLKKFEIGDRVECVDDTDLDLHEDDIPFKGGIYTISAIEPGYDDFDCLGMAELNDDIGTWASYRFRRIEDNALQIVPQIAPNQAAAIDPNDEMFTEDEDEDKAKEFERIVRRREYVRRTEQLRENVVGPALDEFWDGQHLSDAIEKTVVTAPYTMWHL